MAQKHVSNDACSALQNAGRTYGGGIILGGIKAVSCATQDYIIFYKHKGFDVAYREYWKGHNDNKWRWKVKFGRYVNDDEILCWMRK